MHKKLGKGGCFVTKLDLAKAYDRIDWKFLREVLHVVGFQADLIELIMWCVSSSASLLVLWNRKKLSPGWRLRPGDALSPYLFVLSMEVLN